MISSNVTKVLELLLAGGRRWNRKLVETLFGEVENVAILKINILNHAKKDRCCWTGNEKGFFSMENAYAKQMIKKVLIMDRVEGIKSAAKDKIARNTCWKIK
ncbi:D-arabinono-1,4-lactone oxidase family protein, partial [Striga asiatica]